MGKITILPDVLCNQIAAGEVVERPAAVVKELVENSIDAGARRIAVSLEQGGRKEIRALDNGSGMHPDDALLCVERHATSKIRAVEDLKAVQSLGFRGEAIPSIAAVSRFELLTREQGAVSGSLIRIDGGVLKDVREAGCPSGTMVTVRDLFFNVPARRKFLRAVDTELSYISDGFIRIALAHPQIHFQLSHGSRTLQDFAQSKDDLQRAAQIFGGDLARRLRPFSIERGAIRIRGFAGPAEIQKSSGYSLFSFVNGRPVLDKLLNRAILGAYEALIPRGRFPLVVLFLEIPPELVDVNVHPTKREVRFRNPGEVIDAVRYSLLGALEESRPQFHSGPSDLSASHGDSPNAFDSPSFRESPIAREYQTSLPLGPAYDGLPAIKPAFPPERPAPPAESRSFPPRPGDRASEDAEDGAVYFSRLPIIGRIANSFILLEAPDGLVLIDQHAAHERVIFDRLTSSTRKEAAQRLIKSVVVELLPIEAAKLRRWIEPLKELGFEIEPFGGASFMVHAVPAALAEISPEDLVRDILESAHEAEKTPRLSLLTALAKAASCRRAVRAGQRLKFEELKSLLQDLDRSRTSSTCPHGRPLWFKLTHADIARLFNRT